MLCILYVIAVGTLLTSAGILAERVLPAGTARRWIWCVIIPVSVALPGFYRARHTMSVGVLEQAAAGGEGSAALSAVALDAGFWARVEALDPLLNRVWLSASALLLAWGLASTLRVAYLVYAARRRQESQGAAPAVDGVPVLVTESLGPATVGLWRSRVLVPRWVLALPRAQRQYVLRHEDEHRRSHDAQLLFVASLPLVLMPWNAALWWQLRRLRLAVEMDCDNRVVASLGDANAYGGLLLKVAEAAGRGPRLQPALLGGTGMLERRLIALLSPAPLRHIQRVIVPAMALALLLVVLSMPHPVVESSPHDAHSASNAEAAVSAR